MTWQTSEDLDDFDRAAGPLLRADPAAHTIVLTAMDMLRSLGLHAVGPVSPRFGWWRGGDGTVQGALLWTPPFPPVLAATTAEAASAVPGVFPDATGFNTDEGVAEAVRVAYRERTGVELAVSRRTRLHRLATLTPPDPGPPGAARPATVDDRDLILRWFGLFHREVGDEERDLGHVVDDRIAYGGLWFWEVDRVPVALAGRTRPSAGVVRIGPVFTPVELRKRGYAGAVTVAVTRAAQSLADEVVLFTDLANPTSNALYRRLGYAPIADRVVLAAP